MKDDNTHREQPRPPERSTTQRWNSPKLVEYGHLAKLTRGASGTHAEAGGMKKTCL